MEKEIEYTVHFGHNLRGHCPPAKSGIDMAEQYWSQVNIKFAFLYIHVVRDKFGYSIMMNIITNKYHQLWRPN